MPLCTKKTTFYGNLFLVVIILVFGEIKIFKSKHALAHISLHEHYFSWRAQRTEPFSQGLKNLVSGIDDVNRIIQFHEIFVFIRSRKCFLWNHDLLKILTFAEFIQSTRTCFETEVCEDDEKCHNFGFSPIGPVKRSFYVMFLWSRDTQWSWLYLT